ncbi:PaaX family transcriptional regulator [Nonomuraea monospora]
MNARLETVLMPRLQAGAHPQHLLATLLGDYDFAERSPIPSAAIVHLLAEFGITAASARSTLSRLAKRGLIEPVREGRRTSYRLTDKAGQVHDRRIRHFLAFGAAPVPDTGKWTVVAFSVPESQRDQRRVLRVRLQEIGMATLFDGVLIAPGDRRDVAARVLAELSVGTAAALMLVTFDSALFGGRDPLAAYDLDGLRARYDDFITSYTPLLERVRAGAVGISEALVARTKVMDAWRIFPDTDPALPTVLLPPDWPLPAARSLFLAIHDNLGSLAEIRVRNLLEKYIGARAAEIRAYRSDQYLTDD